MNKSRDPNRADLTDAVEDHPVATGVGAAVGGVAGGVMGGAAAGAAAGGVTGPVGAAIGAAAGAIAGGLMGAGAGKAMNPEAEDAYWRTNYSSRPYVQSGSSYDDYGPAYRYGAESYGRYQGRSFDELDSDLERGWSTARGRSSLEWQNAKHAARDAWQRVSDTVERATPGDSDRDGK
jgi:hypothetical protein